MGDAASALAKFLRTHQDAVLERLRACFTPEHAALASSYLYPWFESQLAAAEGREPDRTNQWASLMIENLEGTGAGPAEAVQYVHAFRREMWQFCKGAVPGLDDASLALLLAGYSEHYQAGVAELYAQRVRETIASERRRMRTMAEAIKDPFVTVDVDGRITMANSAFSQAADLPDGDAPGQDFVQLCEQGVAQEIRRAIKQKSPASRTFSGDLVGRRGRTVPSLFHLQPLFDDSGRRDGAAVLIELRDTTQFGPQEYLDHIKQAVVGLLPHPAQVIDKHGRVLYHNASCGEMDLPAFSPDTPACCAFLPRRTENTCPCKKVFETGMPYFAETELKQDEEMLCGLRFVLFPLRLADGEVPQVACIMRDVTEERKRMRILERQVLQHQHDSLASQLAVTVAHQLRNPLGVMVGFAEMLEKGLPPEQVPNAVDRMLRNSIRCKEIVEDLLEFGQGFPGERAFIDLNTLVRDMVQPAFAPARDIRIHWEIEGEPLPVECVPNQIAQVLLSLLENAARAARSAVQFTVSNQGEYAQVSVCDDGPGIPPEIQEHIFEPFFTTRKDEGAVGLGLSLSQAVLEECGGTIRLEAAPGPEWTTCFTAELPQAHTLAHASAAARTEPAERRGQSILVVDDETDLIEMLDMLLDMEGYDVTTCHNAQLALERMQHHQFDAVVLDVQLPGEMNGPQFYDYLASRTPSLAERVLFITADTMSYETRRFLERSHRPSMEKPFRVDEFLAEVARLLEPASNPAEHTGASRSDNTI